MNGRAGLRVWGAAFAAAAALCVAANAQDPAVVNAKTIQVKLENPRVRVMEAALEPGDREQLHNHPGYVVYVLEGGKVRNHAADGKTNDTEFKAGEVYWRDPLTHWAENIGSTTVRFLLVEVKERAR
jgi:quercetin dioxygenase-like cupin family protein